MDRRHFLKATGGAAAVAGAVSASPEASANSIPSAGAGTVRELVLATNLPLDKPGAGDWVRRLASRIEIVSAGRIAVRVTPTTGGAIESLPLAEADLILASPARDVSADPASLAFAGLAGRLALDAREHLAWLETGGGQALWDEFGARHGFKPLLAGFNDAPARLVSTRRLMAPDDFTGLRISADPVGRRIAERLGAAAITLADDQVVRALSARALEAADLRGSFAMPGDADSGLIRYASGLGGDCAGLMLAVRLGLWEHMDAASRALFEAVASESVQHTLAECRMLGSASFRAAGRGPALPPPVRAAIAHASDAANADLAASSPDAARVVASLAHFAALVDGTGPHWGT